ncbi:MAG: caspase family protein [SAR324 cluster bacterium]|nr:caspase family protein [SAR324 cluster bacterium]
MKSKLIIFFLLIPGLIWGEVRSIRLLTMDASGSLVGTYHALLIGNNNYQYWPQLKTAVYDVEKMAEILKKRYIFEPENIKILLNATRKDIIRGFNELREISKPEDNVLIYYGGHGQYDKYGLGFWVPVDGAVDDDSDFLSNSVILERLNTIPAMHKLLISDSCFSGNLMTRGLKQPPPKTSSLDDSFMDRFFFKKS